MTEVKFSVIPINEPQLHLQVLFRSFTHKWAWTCNARTPSFNWASMSISCVRATNILTSFHAAYDWWQKGNSQARGLPLMAKESWDPRNVVFPYFLLHSAAWPLQICSLPIRAFIDIYEFKPFKWSLTVCIELQQQKRMEALKWATGVWKRPAAMIGASWIGAVQRPALDKHDHDARICTGAARPDLPHDKFSKIGHMIIRIL